MIHDAVRKQGLPIPSRIAGYLVLALMLAASVWLWRFWANAEEARVRNHFNEHCERISRDITDRLNTYGMIIEGGVGVFLASVEVTREEWGAYYEYRKVHTQFPGMQAFGVADVVAQDELARHVARIRAEGFPEYRVWPDGERPLYTPVVFMEPFDETNREALGFDPFSDPVRRAAMERARDTASAVMSGRVRLIVGDTDDDVQAGYLIYVPVFASSLPPSGVEARREDVTGYVFAALRVKDLMRDIFAEAPCNAAVELYDGATVSPEALLFASSELRGGSGNGYRARFSRHTALELYGHTWNLAFRSTPQFEATEATCLPWIVLTAGVAVSILVFLLMRSQSRTSTKAKVLAAKLTSNLRESEQRFEQSTRHGRTFVWEVDVEGFYTYASAAVEDLTGYRPEELIGKKTFYDLHPEEGREAFRTAATEIMADRKQFSNLENRVQTKSGAIIWVNTNGIPLRDAEGNLIAYRGTDTDITERKQAEETNTRLVTAIEQSADVIFITDVDATIVYVNPAFEKVTGYSRAEALGQNPRIFNSGKQDAEFYRRMWAVLAAGETWRGRLVNKYKDGTLHEVDTTISPVFDATGKIVNYVTSRHDVTHERLLEDQLRQAQKMEAVGHLAGGVAHDFNNLLMGIMGYAELCREKIEPDHPLREYLDEIMSGARRSAEITRQLLAFARKQTIAPRVLDLNDAVAGMLKLLRRLIGEDIKLTWRPGADVPPVRIDPSQVDQLLANLCVNARDAISGVGEVVLETGHVIIDAEFCAIHPEAIPGAYVFLAVSDDGGGMDQETLAQVFEPFFTTKGLGKGTGLGLATVYGIVKQNNGVIHASSEPGKGTTFMIYLPQVEAGAEKTPETRGEEIPRGRGETVLLVEDEKSLLVTCGRFLEDLGYKVLAAETPGEALALTARRPGDLHVLLTDVVMPGMDGRQLSQRISAVKPGVKVVFMSGYTADVIARRDVLDEGMHFLAKPFTRDDLARKMREVLG